MEALSIGFRNIHWSFYQILISSTVYPSICLVIVVQADLDSRAACITTTRYIDSQWNQNSIELSVISLYFCSLHIKLVFWISDLDTYKMPKWNIFQVLAHCVVRNCLKSFCSICQTFWDRKKGELLWQFPIHIGREREPFHEQIQKSDFYHSIFKSKNLI